MIAWIEMIWRQTSRNDMETEIRVCANTKYDYLNSDRYLQWRMINNDNPQVYGVVVASLDK